jgi:hypothetical protein
MLICEHQWLRFGPFQSLVLFFLFATPFWSGSCELLFNSMILTKFKRLNSLKVYSTPLHDQRALMIMPNCYSNLALNYLKQVKVYFPWERKPTQTCYGQLVNTCAIIDKWYYNKGPQICMNQLKQCICFMKAFLG